MSLFFFGDNFYKNKETFKVFSPHVLELCRILLVETTLESMFYYTFSVINTMFILCTALMYDSTAATQILKLSTTLLSIYCGIRVISFLIMISFVCGLFSQTQYLRLVEMVGIGWPGVIGLAQNESVPWEDMPEVFKCSVREVRGHLISQTEHLNTAGITSNGIDSFRIKLITSVNPISKISTCLTIF